MVKVKQSFNFSGQEIFPLPAGGSICALTFIGKNYLAVSQRSQHCIDIYDLNEKTVESPDSQQKKLKKLTIPTIGEVTDMIYCNSGNYLLLLERNTPSSKSVRVLTNFSSFKKEENLNSYTIAPRIASKTTPSSLYNVFDVIEIPTSNTPRLIACCQSTSALTISCENRLYFYGYRKCLHDIHRFTYIDFVPFKFSIYLSFHPSTLLLSENVICAMNNVYALAFKIVFKKGENSQDTSIITNSFDTDSLDGSSGAAFYDNENKIAAEKSNIFECIDFKTFLNDDKNLLKLKTDKESGVGKEEDESILQNSTQKPVKINSIKVRIIGDLDDDTNSASRFDIKYLIQLCIRSSKASYSNFTCMDIKPVYILPQSTCSTVESYYNPFLSDNYPFCIGYSFLLASNSEGYLYQFGAQESWINDNGKYLATYQFTAPVLKVKIDDFVIQAITTESVETYTSRTAHKIFSNRYEYSQMHGIYPEECSPDLNSPPTLIGLCSFLNIHTACLHDDKLILITDNKTLLPQQQQQSSLRFPVKFRLNSAPVPSAESSLTMYCLKFPHVLHFIDDLETIAQNFLDYNSSTENFFDLMEEANCILRLTQVLNINYITNDTRELLKNKLDKNSKRLAEFTLCSNVMQLEVQAFGYFKMCGVTVDGIYNYFTQNIHCEETKEKVHNGFIYTIKKFLGESHIKSECLQQTVANPIFTESCESTTLAIEFFNMFKMFRPNELATIALKSSIFLNDVNNELTEYLIGKEDKTTIENFLLSLTYFRRRPNAVQMSQDILEKLTRWDISSTLIAFPNIIFEAPDSFTDFMEDILLTMEDKPDVVDGLSDVFITMVSLNRSVTIETLLSIFMDYFSTHIGHKGYKSSQVILSNVLQTHLYNLFSRSFDTNVKKETTEISEKSTTTNEWEGHEQQFHVLNESSTNTFEIDPDYETDSSNFTSLNADKNDQKVVSTYPKESQQASKVLFRIYLGQLKQLSQNTDSESFKSKSYLELYRFVISNADVVKSQHRDGSSVMENRRVLPLLPAKDESGDFRRPIPGIDDRPFYLNKMFPFEHDKHFAKNRRDEGGIVTYDFVGWDDPLVVLLLKIQSLLSSHQTDSLILEDFVEFIHNNTNLLGIESLLTLIVPRPVALNYLIEHYPKLVIPFAVSMKLQPAQWEMFFKNLLNKKDKIPHWEFHLNEILKHLVNEKSYEELILCFPKKYYNVENNPPGSCGLDGRVVMDGIDESNAFQVIIRTAVAKKRSSAIKEMIETTGHQLLQHQL